MKYDCLIPEKLPWLLLRHCMSFLQGPPFFNLSPELARFSRLAADFGIDEDCSVARPSDGCR